MPDVVPVRSSTKRPSTSLIILFSVVFSFSVGIFVGRAQGGSKPASILVDGHAVRQEPAASAGVSGDVDFNQFWQVWSILKDRFYKQPLADKDLYYGAVKGLVAGANDPYTLFMDPKEAKQFADDLDGAFEGIGAQIGEKDGQLVVIAPLPHTPAERAGIKSGDQILAIDKVVTLGMAVDQAVDKIRGKEGTTVTLTTRRGKGTPTDIAILREKITVDSVTWKIEDGIATIDVSIFGPETPTLFTKAVNEALDKGVKGVILDLRGNPGGLLTAGIDVASAWVGYQPVVREKGPGVDESYRGVTAPRLNGLPTVVLVDGGSASASEIVAGALQDYGLATLVGTKTFGKGSVQDLIDLSDGAAVKVTIAAWHTPKDRSIQGTGITPDTVVDFTDKDLHDKRDVQKTKAVEILRARIAGSR